MSIDMIRDDTGGTTVINDGIGLVSTKTGFEEPQSRDEAILQNILGADNELQPPESRIEKILQAILYNTPYTKEPESRIEKILLAIKNNGTYTKEQESRAEAILIAKLKGLEYTEESESRIEELLIEWLDQSTYKTLEGVPPLTFKANGEPLLEWTISGNMQQTGTPTPENPIYPQETGERTGNLCLVSQNNSISFSTFNNYTISNNTVTSTGQALLGFKCKVEPNTAYTVSIKKKGSADLRIREYSSEPSDWQTDFIIQSLNTNQTTATFTTSQDTTWVLVSFWFSTEGNTVYDIALNLGSTALPYEPYGYKNPISSASTTTPVYLGEVESTRQIGMKIFDGSETWSASSNNVYYTQDYITNGYHGYVENGDIICSHYAKSQTPNSQMPDKTIKITGASGDGYTTSRIYLRNTAFSSAAEVQAFMAAQYANGTPVIAWYPLATPTTGIVNEPIRKIGDYADTISNVAEIPTVKGSNTLSVDTTLQPSNVYIKYV